MTTARPSAMRVPSPSAPVAERPAPIEVQIAPNHLPAVAEPNPQPKRNGADAPPAPLAAIPQTFPITGIAAIAGAISAVMSEIGIVAKDGRNKFHNYNYAKMEDVLQKLTPLIAKRGLAIIQTEVDRTMFDNDTVIAVRYAFTIFHTSGEVWPDRPIQTGVSRCRNSKDGFDDKSLNKAHTAARKYFLLALFQIPTGDEDDADRGETTGTATPAASSRRAPVPSPTGHVVPHALAPRDDEKVQTWAPRFIAHVMNAASEAELTQWEKLNDGALNVVFDKAPLLYDTILKAFDTRRGDLGGKPTKKAAGGPPVAPSPDKGASTASAQARPAACREVPDVAESPDEFLKWADAQLAKVIDPHSLEVMFNDHIEPKGGPLMPPDKAELFEIYQRHERRLTE